MLGYVGPGPGVGAIAAFVGMLLAMGSSAFMVLWWPFRRLRRSRAAVVAAGASKD